MDIVYIFQNSKQGNREVLYSLRSVAANLPWVRKVWILGDRPEFLTSDLRVAQHVSHQEIAWIARWRLPVRNNFILTFMASLIPGLSDEFIWFADDYVILQPLDQLTIRKRRAVEHLADVKTPGTGLYKEAIWRTKSVLSRLSYPTINFEAHLPQTYRREWIWHAFRQFRDFISEDRYYGMLVHTAILNFVVKRYSLPYEMLADENRFLGIYPDYVVGLDADGASTTVLKTPIQSLTPALLRETCERKYFLNFNDGSFAGLIGDYLAERFSQPCRLEK